jgi:hypothetical protein
MTDDKKRDPIRAAEEMREKETEYKCAKHGRPILSIGWCPECEPEFAKGVARLLNPPESDPSFRAAAEECSYKIASIYYMEETVYEFLSAEMRRERERCWTWAHEHTIGRVTDEELLKYIRQGGE